MTSKYKYGIERFHRMCPECNKKLMVEYNNEQPYSILYDADANYPKIHGILVAISCPSCRRHLKYMTTDPEFISDFDDGKSPNPLTKSVDEARTCLVFFKLIFGKAVPCYKALVTGKALNKNEKIVVKGGI